MKLEIIVKPSKSNRNLISASSIIYKLIGSINLQPPQITTHFTNNPSIHFPPIEEFGKYVHAVFNLTDPQEAYRNLSNAGFFLVDSKITR